MNNFIGIILSKTTTFDFIVSVGAGIFVTMVILISLLKKYKSSHNTNEYYTKVKKQIKNNSNIDEVYYCEYCGTPLKNKNDKCPNCGARHK